MHSVRSPSISQQLHLERLGVRLLIHAFVTSVPQQTLWTSTLHQVPCSCPELQPGTRQRRCLPARSLKTSRAGRLINLPYLMVLCQQREETGLVPPSGVSEVADERRHLPRAICSRVLKRIGSFFSEAQSCPGACHELYLPFLPHEHWSSSKGRVTSQRGCLIKWEETKRPAIS